jgi:hypothetical protein
MSRPSTLAKLATVPSAGIRPDPPEDLTPAQAAVWRGTVASEAADFFRTAALQALLYDYCCHKAAAADLSKQINLYDMDSAMPPNVLAALNVLLNARARETHAAADKATKLRLTNQSRYTPQAAATAAKNASTQKKPWEAA